MAVNGVISNSTAAEPMPKPVQDLPPMGAYANQFLRGQTAAIQNGIPSFPNASRAFIKTLPDTLYQADSTDMGGQFKVGIVGAGCAGLFTAMICNYLNSLEQLQALGLNIQYEILESNKSERLGGRLYTYKFPEQQGWPVGDHEYYDVGGMRFPDNPTMKKTFELFEMLYMTSDYKDRDWKAWKETFDNASAAEQQKMIFNQPSVKDVKYGQLIPYYMAGKNCPMIFNGVQTLKPEWKDFMCAKDFKIDGLPGRVVTADPGALVDDFVEEYRIKYHEDGPKAFWDLLQEKGDAYSVRQYLTNWARYDYNTIEFLEVMNFGNRWYDQAFSEMVVDSMEFDYALSGERVWWWCVMGGAQQLPIKMANPGIPLLPSTPKDETAEEKAKRLRLESGRLSLQPLVVNHYKKVTKIAYEWPTDQEDRSHCITPKVNVTYKNVDPGSSEKGKLTTTKYDAVFNSTSLGVQQHMALEGLSLNWGTKQAIRSLGYGASSKVGIRFKTLWWMDDKNDLGVDLGITKGGIGHTDESIGFCVYPSYNIDDDPKKPGVLLASYNWSQAAQRLSTLIDRGSPENEDTLKDLLLDDLARLHASQAVDPKQEPDQSKWPAIIEERYTKMLDFLHNQYLNHYAWDWYHDENTAGAFAFFGPGQFKNMYPWIIRSNGTYLTIGEAASSNHAWVVGALDSAVRAVYQFLWVRSRNSKACSEAAKLFVQEPVPGSPESTLSSLFLELPPEFNRTDDVKDDGTTKKSSPIGEFLRQGVFTECCRLLQQQDQLNPAKVTQKVIDTVLVNNTVKSA